MTERNLDFFQTKDKKNISYVLELLEIIQLSKSLVIIKIPGHSMANTEESRSNHLADTAKLAALKQSQSLMETPKLPTEVIGDFKKRLTEECHLAV